MNDDTRLEEMVDRVIEGRSIISVPDPDEASVEAAVASATQALVGSETPPQSLRERLRRDAAAFAEAAPMGGKVVRFPASTEGSRVRENPWFPRRAWGWQAAAAAALVFAVWSTLRTPAPVPSLSASVQRDAVAAAADGVRAPFVPGFEQYSNLQGDVVWSTTQQDGFLRLRGLPVNDPQRSQYQLWIVDPERDAEFPVDGGVFDVPSGSEEALVRFHPRLPIGRPAAFVITLEVPGGVVKSRNAKPVAIAQL